MKFAPTGSKTFEKWHANTLVVISCSIRFAYIELPKRYKRSARFMAIRSAISAVRFIRVSPPRAACCVAFRSSLSLSLLFILFFLFLSSPHNLQYIFMRDDFLLSRRSPRAKRKDGKIQRNVGRRRVLFCLILYAPLHPAKKYYAYFSIRNTPCECRNYLNESVGCA